MLNKLREFHASFHDSEVILWARIQIMIGCGYVALQGVDMSALISDRHLLQAYIFGNAFITEALRRNRETWTPPAVTPPKDPQ